MAVLVCNAFFCDAAAQSSMMQKEPVVQPGRHGLPSGKRPVLNNHHASEATGGAEMPDSTVSGEKSQTKISWTGVPADAGSDTEVSAVSTVAVSEPSAGLSDTIRSADFSFYLKLANEGDTEAQRRVGICYLYGTGVKRDPRQGKEWIAKAALNENTEAQYNLGVMFRDGYGVKVNYPDAAYWFRKAARNGNAKAQLCTGLMFYEGKGVQQDYRIAAENFWRAAEQGNVDGAYRFAVMCRDGLGVPKDLSRAYHYFTVAASKGEYKDAAAQARDLKQYYRPAKPRHIRKTSPRRRRSK